MRLLWPSQLAVIPLGRMGEVFVRHRVCSGQSWLQLGSGAWSRPQGPGQGTLLAWFQGCCFSQQKEEEDAGLPGATFLLWGSALPFLSE